MKKCIIVGLPEAGKSTYIGAFWAIEKDGDTGHKLVCSKYPEDSVYLDSLKSSWKKQKEVNRSNQLEENEIIFELSSQSSTEAITLCIPDFKGEKFQSIIQNNIASEIDKWFKESDTVLFFLKYQERDTLQDETSFPNPENKQDQARVLTTNEMSEWTKNIILFSNFWQMFSYLILEFLHKLKNFITRDLFKTNGATITHTYFSYAVVSGIEW